MFRKILIINSIISILVFSTCENYFGDTNENPNRPIDIPVTVLLPAIQVEIAQIYGGEFSRYSSILVQHGQGVARSWSSLNSYGTFTPSTFNNAWINTYVNILNETKILKAKAAEGRYNHYEGVANILTAFHLMNATDVWGDIPFSNALNGIDNIGDNFATFDSQESLYNIIFTLLDDAIIKLGSDDGGLPINNDDLYFYNHIINDNGGSYNDLITAWIKAAYGIKARGYLHLGLVDNANYGRALASAALSFSDASEDMTLQFPGGSTSAAPWFIFNRDRTGDIEFHPTMRNQMMMTQDTSRLGILDEPFTPDHPFFTAEYNEPLITFRELKFLEAEALMMSGGATADIHAAWTAGVNAAFDFFGTGGATEFLAANDPGVGNLTLEDIILQKGVALYATMEPYNDWRRTGLPVLIPNNGLAIPTRFPYGSDEIAFNPNTPNLTIFDKVWWDQN